MQRTSFEDMTCSVAQCLDVVGEWWSLLIVRDAFLGVTRFDDFQARLGISRNILTRRLNHLVDNGILKRVPCSDHPPRGPPCDRRAPGTRPADDDDRHSRPDTTRSCHSFAAPAASARK